MHLRNYCAASLLITELSICWIRVELVVCCSVLQIERHDRIEDVVQFASFACFAHIGQGILQRRIGEAGCQYVLHLSRREAEMLGHELVIFLRLLLAVVDGFIDAFQKVDVFLRIGLQIILAGTDDVDDDPPVILR